MGTDDRRAHVQAELDAIKADRQRRQEQAEARRRQLAEMRSEDEAWRRHLNSESRKAGRPVPTITLRRCVDPARLLVWLPPQDGNKQALRDALPAGSHVEWDDDRKVWYLAARHTFDLVTAMVEAGERVRLVVDLKGEAAGGEKCDKRCVEAEGSSCTCECNGKYHGRGFWPDGFVQVETGDTVTAVKMRRMTQVYEMGGE